MGVGARKLRVSSGINKDALSRRSNPSQGSAVPLTSLGARTLGCLPYNAARVS